MLERLRGQVLRYGYSSYCLNCEAYQKLIPETLRCNLRLDDLFPRLFFKKKNDINGGYHRSRDLWSDASVALLLTPEKPLKMLNTIGDIGYLEILADISYVSLHSLVDT